MAGEKKEEKPVVNNYVTISYGPLGDKMVTMTKEQARLLYDTLGEVLGLKKPEAGVDDVMKKLMDQMRKAGEDSGRRTRWPDPFNPPPQIPNDPYPYFPKIWWSTEPPKAI